MSLGQNNDLGEYCGLSTASSGFLILFLLPMILQKIKHDGVSGRVLIFFGVIPYPSFKIGASNSRCAISLKGTKRQQSGKVVKNIRNTTSQAN